MTGIGNNEAKRLGEWRTVMGHEDYEVNNVGVIRCRRQRRFLKVGQVIAQHVLPKGYIVASLDGSNKLVHRIVCLAFNGPPPSAMHEAAHNNGIRSDNRSSNLRWATHTENCADIKAHGTANPPRGEIQGRSKLTASDVKQIRKQLICGQTHGEIASVYGIARTTVSAINNNRIWRHL